jgi:predicted RNase H-like HicB family nuclease
LKVPKTCHVHAQWDTEAKVWVATSGDVPGLAAEAATLDELSAKLDDMVPELLQLNEGINLH